MVQRNHLKRRRGISGLMQVAMIVGIVVIFASVLFAFANEIFTVQTTSNSIAMQRVHMYNANGETYVAANVKNTGNHEISGVTLSVLVDTDPDTADIEPFERDITPSVLEPGVAGSVHERLTFANGTAFGLTTGQEAAVVIEATSSDGSLVAESAAVRVR